MSGKRERFTPIYDRMFDPTHELAGEPVCRRWAFADLCHMARWEDGNKIIKGSLVAMKRGQFIASERYLSNRWMWSRGKVRRFLAQLASEEVGKIRPINDTSHGTIYLIVSYDDYAAPRPSNEPTNRTNGGPPTDHRQDQTTTRIQQGVTTTSAAVGDFLERTGSKWRLDKPIDAWASEICSEARYAGADIDYEIGKCADWHVNHRKKPSAPDLSIRNWLERAANDAKKVNGKKPTGIDRPLPLLSDAV